MFIPRDNGPEAVAMVRELGRSIDATTAIVIFPEGRLFRPDRLERAKTRLALENSERSARLASLGHVLPVRAQAGSSRWSTSSPPTSSSSPTPGSTSTHRSPNSPKPSRSATRSTSRRGEFHESRSQTVTPNASSGSTNNGCSSTTGSRPEGHTGRTAALTPTAEPGGGQRPPVVGSMITLTGVTTSAGKPPQVACSRTASGLSAM